MTLAPFGCRNVEVVTQKVGRAALVALSVTTIASLCADAGLVRASLHYFDASETIRLDPGGLKIYAKERTTPAPDSPLLVFFGDSRAFMWSPPAATPGYHIVNRGISYQTTAQMVLRLDADVLELRPAVVVVEGGVNDLKAIASFPERRSEIIADCEANLERMVDRCRKAGAKVVLVSVFAIGDVALWRRPFWSGDVANAVREVNAFLPQLAGDGVVLFDANTVLVGDDGGIRPVYQLDYLHLNAAGYAALNEKLTPIVAALQK